MDSIGTMVAKRIALGLLTLIVISLLIFLGVELLPGDVAEAILGQSALPETVEAFRRELKLDLPPHIRYFTWLGDFFQGDFGNSLANKRPIADLIGWRFANTIFLATSAAVMAVPMSISWGFWQRFTATVCLTVSFLWSRSVRFHSPSFLWPIF